MITIEHISPESINKIIPSLAALLQNAVSHGASIGFLLPISDQEALDYWNEVAKAIEDPHRILLIAKADNEVAGTVQLDLAAAPMEAIVRRSSSSWYIHLFVNKELHKG